MKKSKAYIAQHLAVLKKVGLVKKSRKGRFVYYRIVNTHIIDLCKFLETLRKKGVIA